MRVIVTFVSVNTLLFMANTTSGLDYAIVYHMLMFYTLSLTYFLRHSNRNQADFAKTTMTSIDFIIQTQSWHIFSFSFFRFTWSCSSLISKIFARQTRLTYLFALVNHKRNKKLFYVRIVRGRQSCFVLFRT